MNKENLSAEVFKKIADLQDKYSGHHDIEYVIFQTYLDGYCDGIEKSRLTIKEA